MANPHENNPFIPNSKAWWCPKCKAHHDYDYSESYGSSSSGVGRTTYGKYSCKACRATMLCPAKTLPWMYGLTGGGIILLAMGLWMGVSKGGFDFENGIELFYLLFAIFPLFDWRDDDSLHEEVVRLVVRPKEENSGGTGTGSQESPTFKGRGFRKIGGA